MGGLWRFLRVLPRVVVLVIWWWVLAPLGVMKLISAALGLVVLGFCLDGWWGVLLALAAFYGGLLIWVVLLKLPSLVRRLFSKKG